MNKHIKVDQSGTELMYSERWEADYLCNRFGLSRATARNIVESYGGDRARMEQEAERLAVYERLR